VPLADDVDIEDLARSMPGRSGADLQNLVNEAALLAARHEKNAVGMDQFRTARDKILMGQLRGGIVLKGREKHAVAVHEAGHAVTALLSPEADPVEKISILPRGRSLGATQQLPEERYNLTEEYLRGRLKVMLGGRAAEQVFLNTQTTGAADDLAQATTLARRMVGQWGMSEKLRHLAFQETETEVFLGEQLSRRRQYSEQTAREIDTEVKNLLDGLYGEVETLLQDNRDRVQRLAEALEEEETIEGDRLSELLGEPPEREQHADSETESRGQNDAGATPATA
jgi:cell division protease FtsH